MIAGPLTCPADYFDISICAPCMAVFGTSESMRFHRWRRSAAG